MKSIFEQYPNQLDKAYDLLLADSFSKNIWNTGNYKTQRINWKDAPKARKEIDEFHKSGIYIWGFDKTPLYVGKAEELTFAKRFNRYAFGEKCQCRVGEKYSSQLKNGVGEKTYSELRIEFDMQSNSRALGAKTFGEIGAEKIWFILIPVKYEFITEIETELIYVAERWNKEKGYRDLINIERIKNTKEKKKQNQK